tara:strand:+ start:6308 stop:7648 length:1341 start_codon:yes stop_codon:yes gene_type:complete
MRNKQYFDEDELIKAAEENEFIINPIFEPLFIDTLDQPKYYQVFGGRGSGKSTAAAVAMVELTYSLFNHKILYVRQTMTSIEDSSIEDVRTAIKDLELDSDFKEIKGKIINKVTGNTIGFKGIRSSGSSTAKLKSLSGITTVVFEEAEEIEDFEEWSKIDEGVRKKGVPLKIIMLYNPTSALSSWIHEQWFEDGRPRQDRLDDTVFLHSTYLDNLDNLNAKSIEGYERLKKTNPIYYRNTILAEWTLEASERIYAGWDLLSKMDEVGDVWYGMDFGYGGKDHTAITKINWIDGKYYCTEILSLPKLSIRSTLTAMRKAGIPFNARIFADSAMPLLITEIRDGGFTGIRKCTKGNVSEAVKKVQDKQIVIVGEKDSGLWYHHLTWQRTKGELKNHEPDILASLRYGILSKRPTRHPSGLPKRPAKRKIGYQGSSGSSFTGSGGSGFI